MLWNALSRRMPALLMTMSTLPNASSARLHDGRAALRGGDGARVGDGLTAECRDLVHHPFGCALVAPGSVDTAAEVVDDEECATRGEERARAGGRGHRRRR